MIGYDRPLKPEWIYETLRLVEPGRKPEEFYDAYNKIAVELTGIDGRRKTRTVLFRTFIYSLQETKSTIHNNFLIQLSKEREFSYMKPIYLAMFIMDYAILRYFTQTYFKIFDVSQVVSSTALTRKMTDSYGDAEIIKRSTRAFFKTLLDFGIIQSKSTTTFEQIRRSELSEEQVADILKLYALYNHTKQLNLKGLDKSIFSFYQIPDLSNVANNFHTIHWEYIKGIDRELLMMA